MRFVIDISADAEGRVSGQLAPADEPLVPFSGWLELLRLLEGLIEAGTAGGSRPAPGRNTQESS